VRREDDGPVGEGRSARAPAAAAAAGVLPRVGTVAGVGGTRLRTLSWTAEAPRGRVLVVHGLGEHGGRFDVLARALVARGYSVLAYDHRGHGKSEGRPGHVSDFRLFLEDMDMVARAAAELPGPGGVFLYGHSMGALVTMRYLQVFRPAAPGVILSAPWLGTVTPIPRWKLLLAHVLRRSVPWLAIPTAVEPGKLTSDEEMQRRYLEDPLVRHAISVSLYDAVLDAQQRVFEWDGEVDVPVLMLLPLLDTVVDTERAARWSREAGPAVEALRLPGFRHEPHNERGREGLFATIADWLDLRTPGKSGG